MVFEFASRGDARVLNTGTDLSSPTCVTAGLIATRGLQTLFPRSNTKRNDPIDRCALTLEFLPGHNPRDSRASVSIFWQSPSGPRSGNCIAHHR
jgi:hypothetical protein